MSTRAYNQAYYQANKERLKAPLTDTELRAVAVPVSAASLPLPSGAATGAKQDTGNTSLSSIDGKITAVNTGAVSFNGVAQPAFFWYSMPAGGAPPAGLPPQMMT